MPLAVPTSGVASLSSAVGDLCILGVFHFLLISYEITHLSLPSVILIASYVFSCVLFDLE